MTDKFSNNEILQMLKGLVEKVDAGFDGVHNRQDKTNGNIKDNADDITNLKVWRGFITGGLAILGCIVIPLLVIVLKKVY